MSLASQRAEIDRLLRGRPLSADEWKWLRKQGYTEYAEWDAEGGGAIGAARKIKERRSAMSGKPAPDRPREERAPPGWQRARLQSLALVYARLAEAETSVPRLRTRVAADALPEGALAAWITERYYAGWGVTDSDGISAAIGRHLYSGRTCAELWYRADGAIQVVAVPEASLLGDIAKVASALSDRFRWNPWEATRWVVCGGDPPLPWVFRWKPDLRGLHRGEVTDTATRLTIEVDPTLTPAEVAAAYGRARAAIFRGARLRPLEEKAQALVRFVVAQPEDMEDVSWDELLRRWNAGPGRSHGKYDREDWQRWNFRRELRAAWNRLVRVGWRVPRGSG